MITRGQSTIDSTYTSSDSSKRGLAKTSKSVSIDYVETAKESTLTANNINLTSADNVLLQAANLNSTKDTNITSANNTYIQNAMLNEYHYDHTSRGYTGIAKVGANITSTALGIVGGVFHLAGNIVAPIDGGLFREGSDKPAKIRGQFTN